MIRNAAVAFKRMKLLVLEREKRLVDHFKNRFRATLICTQDFVKARQNFSKTLRKLRLYCKHFLFKILQR